eukprot:SM000034S12695  [mRNA]  locus=s34:192552:199976:- [translate_table: standard]
MRRSSAGPCPFLWQTGLCLRAGRDSRKDVGQEPARRPGAARAHQDQAGQDGREIEPRRSSSSAPPPPRVPDEAAGAIGSSTLSAASLSPSSSWEGHQGSDADRRDGGLAVWSSVFESSSDGPPAESSPSPGEAGLRVPGRRDASEKYIMHVEGGGQVAAWVAELPGKVIVDLEACMTEMKLHRDRPLYLHWGLFRSDREGWVMLEASQAPPGTRFLEDDVEAMRSPWVEEADGVRTLQITLDAGMQPLGLSFVLYQPAKDDGDTEIWLRSTRQSNFCLPIGMKKGSPVPLGCTWLADGPVNFALYSRNADGVVLCLYTEDAAEPSMEIDLEPAAHRTADVWHIQLRDVSSYARYGYRVKGEISWEHGSRFHSRHVLLDPYAHTIANHVPGQEELPSPAAALGLLCEPDMSFDWEDDYPPRLPMQKLSVYDMNVRGFTIDESSRVDEELRGTFAGVIEKIEHLLNLGVNAVLLQPIAAFDENQGFNFPISFFAPDPSFGPQGSGLAASFWLKAMVKELHKHGIEVFMNVLYSHTAERSDENPLTVSFRGIDSSVYYIIDQHGGLAVPEYGAGCEFNCNHPAVQKMIVDSLRHWVEEYHIDGFSFPNAVALTTGPHGQEVSRPLLVEAMSFDPVLADVKLIADPSSPPTGQVKDMTFPHWGRWSEWNVDFKDDVRRWMRGEFGQLSRLAATLVGSVDVLANGRGPHHAFNRITASYGFSLADLVSFSSESEISWNSGEEGPSDNFMVMETRVRQVKNFLFCLLMAQGVPVVSMGDEYGHTKGGSTLPEDTDSCFRWDALDSDFGRHVTRFISCLSAFRKRRQALLQRRDFLPPNRVTWHGLTPLQPAWDSPDSCFLGFEIQSAPSSNASRKPRPAVIADPDKGNLYIAFNAHHYPVTITLPEASDGMGWFRVVDTSLNSPHDYDLGGTEIHPAEEGLECKYDLQSYGALLLEARIPLGPGGVRRPRKAAASAAAAPSLDAFAVPIPARAARVAAP